VRVLAIVIGLVCVALPAGALARPKTKIAVAPLVGDGNGKIAAAVVDALSGVDYAVTGPKETGREITRLGLPDELDAKASRKLARKLGVAAVIDGKLSKAGGKRFLHLAVHRRGVPEDGFTVEFKTASKAFRRSVRDEITSKLEGAGDDRDDDDAADDAGRPRTLAETGAGRSDRASDDADAERKRVAADEDAARKRKLADDEDGARKRKLDDGARKRPAEPARRSRRVAAGDGDDDTAAVRKRRRRARDDEAAAPLLTARVGAGGSVAQRELSWQLRSGFTQVPPRVLTYAGSGRVDGELYPLALADPGSALAGLGLAAAYDKTFGLSIKIPNQTIRAPINQSHYTVGARFRFAVGEASSIALGLDYARRKYTADRGGLMGAALDAPDVDYAAVSPVVAIRVPITGSVAVFGGADGLLVFEAGGIQKSASYGPAKVYGLEGSAGVDIALAKQIALRIAVEYSQIAFSFKPQGATLANNRDADPTSQDVMGATDRSIGGAVTLGLVY